MPIFLCVFFEMAEGFHLSNEFHDLSWTLLYLSLRSIIFSCNLNEIMIYDLRYITRFVASARSIHSSLISSISPHE